MPTTRRNQRRRSQKRQSMRRLRKQRGGMDLTSFNTVIGAGGFGKVVKHSTDPVVVKLYYDATSCGESEKEFSALGRAFTAVAPFVDEKQIYVPQPLGFENTAHTWKSEPYSCVLQLGFVDHLPGYGLIHIILKEENKRHFNRNVGKNYGKPVSANNPSRGFFATGSYLDSHILPTVPDAVKGALRTANDVANRFGFLYGMLVNGGIYPFDVEFSIGLVRGRLHVIALDFNLAAPIKETEEEPDVAKKLVNGADGISGALIDLYVPYHGEPTWDAWEAGVREAITMSNPRSAAILTEFLKEYKEA
jgi:hypothetical protein